MTVGTDAKENFLAAALHYNPELKAEIEEWLRNIVRQELNRGYNFEREHINNFTTFRRLIREAMKQDLEALRSSGM